MIYVLESIVSFIGAIVREQYCIRCSTSTTGGYTIYSTMQGWCCIHGPVRHGCLRLRGQFVSFPDSEDAKHLIQHFRSQGITSWESMVRSVPEGEYVCVNSSEQYYTSLSSRPMQRVA